MSRPLIKFVLVCCWALSFSLCAKSYAPVDVVFEPLQDAENPLLYTVTIRLIPQTKLRRMEVKIHTDEGLTLINEIPDYKFKDLSAKQYEELVIALKLAVPVAYLSVLISTENRFGQREAKSVSFRMGDLATPANRHQSEANTPLKLLHGSIRQRP
jgi:hypothetical protein